MSDEDESEVDSENDNSNDDSDDNESKNDDDGISLINQEKENKVNEDIDLINDIFKYIDQVTKRITNKLSLDNQISSQQLINDNINQELLPIYDKKSTNNNMQHQHLSWSQYEDLNEAERAMLLEKAIMVLSNENELENTNTNTNNSKNPRRGMKNNH
eukprot:gene5175-7202_t